VASRLYLALSGQEEEARCEGEMMLYPLALAATVLTAQDAAPEVVEVLQASPAFEAARDAGDAAKALALI
jgi:hypothetical protein